MARSRHSDEDEDEDCSRILQKGRIRFGGGWDVTKACRTAEITDATYNTWPKKFGCM